MIAATRPLSLRDISDVEAYVGDTLAGMRLPTGSRDTEWLHRAGIATVARFEQALPPERPLAPMLDSLLPERLMALWQERMAAPAVSRAA
jgi:hypothetical protein